MPDQPWATRRSALSVQLLTQFGLDHGLALEDCLHGSGLDLAVLADPAREIDAACELQVLRNLAQRLPAGSGLQAGLRYHLNAYGIWVSPCSAARPSAAPPSSACATWG